jgi:hypothetical protein
MLLMSTQRRERSGNGVRFREAMTGRLHASGITRAARFSLDAHIAGWEPFLRDRSHAIAISGTIDSRELPRPVRLPARWNSSPMLVTSPCCTGSIDVRQFPSSDTARCR